VQPANYFDGINTVGSTSGIAVNSNQPASQTVLLSFANVGIQLDAIVRIPLAFGQHSQNNNFSEVLVFPPPPPEIPPKVPPPPPLPPPPPQILFAAADQSAQPRVPKELSRGRQPRLHVARALSMRAPRVQQRWLPQDATVFHNAAFLDRTQWQPTIRPGQ
jgi:hypothetical protein